MTLFKEHGPPSEQRGGSACGPARRAGGGETREGTRNHIHRAPLSANSQASLHLTGRGTEDRGEDAGARTTATRV